MHILDSFRTWYHDHSAEIDALVFDVDGVLLVSHTPIPGACELLGELRLRGVPLALLTNDGNHSVAEKRTHLLACGLDFREEEITSCSHGLEEAASARDLLGKRVFVLGALGRPDFAESAGMLVTRELSEIETCAGVVVGESRYDWEPTINCAINFLIRHPDRPLVVPNPDEYYPGQNGEVIVAAGGVARFIQRVVGVHGQAIEPVYLGKPYRPIFEHSHRRLEQRVGRRIEPARVMMLGDSLASDVAGSKGYGYRSGLMLTGITREFHLRRADPKPDVVFRGY